MLISPQSWGKMFISKHHYAVELAKRGNHVFFLNPPDATLKERVLIRAVEETPGLFIISHRLYFPYNIKFHAIGIFHCLMKWQVKKILHAIEKPVDIIWSFDLGNLYPFRFFPKNAKRIFHPVDEPLNNTAIDSANGAAFIFSVTPEILEKYSNYLVPKYVINHGISDEFLKTIAAQKTEQQILVGFSGNLLRPDIDRSILLQIIKENPEVIFECWGSYSANEANLSGEVDVNTGEFINELQKKNNVKLHGTVSASHLAGQLNRMDAFLVCYDVQKDQSKGTNYHKLMEYISTGKVTIANNVSAYKNKPELVQMVEEREHNKMLPILFKKIISSLDDYNSVLLQESRIKYASGNSYSRQIERIEQVLQNNR